MLSGRNPASYCEKSALSVILRFLWSVVELAAKTLCSRRSCVMSFGLLLVYTPSDITRSMRCPLLGCWPNAASDRHKASRIGVLPYMYSRSVSSTVSPLRCSSPLTLVARFPSRRSSKLTTSATGWLANSAKSESYPLQICRFISMAREESTAASSAASVALFATRAPTVAPAIYWTERKALCHPRNYRSDFTCAFSGLSGLKGPRARDSFDELLGPLRVPFQIRIDNARLAVRKAFLDVLEPDYSLVRRLPR